MLDVNSKNRSNNAKYLKVYCWKVESKTEWQTLVIKREISYSDLEMGGYGAKSGVSWIIQES